MTRAKIDFHRHEKNVGVIEFVIKLSETCGFSCLTLTLIMNQEEEGAESFTEGPKCFGLTFFSSL